MDKIVIGYDIPDLTHLRYFVPFASAVDRTLASEHRFFYTRSSSKYNGLRSEQNWNAFSRVVDQLSYVTPIEKDANVECDVLVTVESTDEVIKRRRHVALCHGVDSIHHAQALTKCDMYVCGRPIAKSGLVDNLNVHVHPAPPSMWTLNELDSWAYKNHRELSGIAVEDYVATVFYPDKGSNDIADATVERLVDNGYTVYVKQRKKWQGITTSAGIHVYDVTWQPSEAITLPLASDVVVGFGSTAYLDLVEIGVPYVNVDVIGDHVHIESDYYKRCDHDVESIIEAVVNMPPADIGWRCTRGELEDFIREIML